MLVTKNGKTIDVTEKAFKSVYEPRGFQVAPQPALKSERDEKVTTDGVIAPESQSAVRASEGRMTQEEYAAVIKNKGNVTAKLKALGVEFEEDTKAEPLKELLDSELAARDLLPE